MSDSDILAVNGPPGTGKTTFVLSVVASLWIESALKEEDPNIAASTKKQAVTNVIDAFGKDFDNCCFIQCREMCQAMVDISASAKKGMKHPKISNP